MDKRLLKTLSVPTAPQHIKTLASRYASYQYFLKARFDQKHGILILAAFSHDFICAGRNEPDYVFYQSKSQYVTADFTSDSLKWRTGKFSHYIDINKATFLTVKDERAVAHAYFLKKIEWKYLHSSAKFIHLNALQMLVCKQQELLDAQQKIRYQRKVSRWKQVMETIPALPRNFAKWVDAEPLKTSRYIVYKRLTAKRSEGFCTHCKSMVTLTDTPAHNQTAICPTCHSEITYKAQGRVKTLKDSVFATLLQKTKDGKIVVRFFEYTRSFVRDYRNPETSEFEYGRRIFNTQGNVEAWYVWNPQHVSRWAPGLEHHYRGGTWMHPVRYHGFQKGSLYTANLEKTVAGTWLQYSLIQLYAGIKGRLCVAAAFVEYFKEYPMIEYLLKLGLPRLVDFILCAPDYEILKLIHLHGKGFSGVLGLPLSALPQLQRLNADEKILKVIASSPRLLHDEDVLWLAESKLNTEQVTRLLHYTTMRQIRRYIEAKQLRPQEIRDWLDYLEMANILGYDTKNDFVIFPKNLKKSHNEAMELIKLDPKIYDRAISEQYEHLKKFYFYKNKRFMIIPPRNAQELIDEGQKLRHCVGNYARKVAMGQCQVFFIRRLDEPFRSYYTLELDGSEVIQCRGFGNKGYDTEMGLFIAKWRAKKVVPAIQYTWNSAESAA